MIEKNIFQTYKKKYSELDEYALYTSSTWINKNSDWKYNYFCDESILDFANDIFGKEWLEILINKCPIGVMKSDIWRFMCLYQYGGIYADLDTICTEDINSWGLDLDYSSIFNIGPDNLIINWAFMGKSKSSVFENILNNIAIAVHNEKPVCKDFVYKTTGPYVVTDSVFQYINKNKYDKVNIIQDTEFFVSKKIVHLNASKYWNFSSYESWNDELDRLLNETI